MAGPHHTLVPCCRPARSSLFATRGGNGCPENGDRKESSGLGNGARNAGGDGGRHQCDWLKFNTSVERARPELFAEVYGVAGSFKNFDVGI